MKNRECKARAIVRLTNAMDASLFRQKKVKRVRSAILNAKVDQRAVRIVLPEAIVKKLGLRIRSDYGAIRKTEPVEIELEGRTTAEESVVMGMDVVIGRSVLASLDLFVDCKSRRLVPNPAHPNEAVIKVK